MRELVQSAMWMMMIGVLFVAGPGCEVEDDISSLEYACANGIIQNLVSGDTVKKIKRAH